MNKCLSFENESRIFGQQENVPYIPNYSMAIYVTVQVRYITDSLQNRESSYLTPHGVETAGMGKTSLSLALIQLYTC